MATIKPHASEVWTHKQSKHSHVPELPFRMVALGPSGSGKTVFMASLILDIYPKCWERIYVFSPTVHLDSTWNKIKAYNRDVLKVPEKEETFFSEWDEAAVQKILKRQHEITRISKERGLKKLFGVLCIVDDFADDARVVRSSKAIHELFVRGRHAQISTICSVQKYRVLNPIIRVNATDLVVFRLRSMHEADAVVDENSALYGEKVTREILKMATDEPYSFLWINGRAKKREDTFWLKFDARLVP